MPSEAHIASVHCLMVREHIPASLCEAEQRPDACRGCTSATRRCAKCGMQNGIAEAATGLCGKCLAAEGTGINTTDELETISSFEDALEKVSKVGRLRMPIPQTQTKVRSQVQIGTSPLLQDPAPLYRLLMQHATGHCDTWTARAPVTILMRRAHLLRTECHEALSRLAADDFLTGKSPWDVVTLLKTEGLEELKAEMETVTARTGRMPASRSRRQQSASTTPPARPSIVSGGWGARRHPGLESHRGKVTHREIAEFLKGRAVRVNEERLVPGVVPTLQMQFHLRAPDVIAILTELEKCGFLGQKDAWRTIAILRDDIVVAEAEDQPTPDQSSAEETVSEGVQKRHEAVETAPVSPMTPPPTPPTSLVVPTPPRAIPQSPPKPAGPTYAEMYAFLVQRSAEVQGERRTGGSLPQLQIRFKLSVPDATAAMKWFVAMGHVVQRDGWRTVALLSESVGSVDSPKTATPLKRSSKLRGSPPEARTVTASVPSAQYPVPQGTDSLTATVKALERDSVALRGQQDESAQKLKELEAMITSLKVLQDAKPSLPSSKQSPRREAKSPMALPRPPRDRPKPVLPKGAHHMNKEKLAAYLAEACQTTREQAEAFVEEFAHVVTGVLQGGGSVSIVGFGEFFAKVRKGRMGVDPRTLQPTQIPTVVVPKFKAGKRLKDALKG